jgi:hypothetical protein
VLFLSHGSIKNMLKRLIDAKAGLNLTALFNPPTTGRRRVLCCILEAWSYRGMQA